LNPFKSIVLVLVAALKPETKLLNGSKNTPHNKISITIVIWTNQTCH